MFKEATFWAVSNVSYWVISEINYFGICFEGVLSCHIKWTRVKMCKVLKILKFLIVAWTL